MWGLFSDNSSCKRKDIAEAGLDWLWRHRNQFLIVGSDDEEMPWEVKSLVELAFLLTVLQRHNLSCDRSRQLTEFVARGAQDFDWHELAAFDPSAATVIATIGWFCDVSGVQRPFEDDYLGYLVHVGFFNGMDRLPYRQMDLAYNLSGIGIPDYQHMLMPCFHQTAFGQRQPIVRYSVGDIYSLTHAVFYITDTGLQPLPLELTGSTQGRLRRELVALTVVIIRANNLDLLGELLICWLMTGLQPTSAEHRIFATAMAEFSSGRTGDGAVYPTRRKRENSLSVKENSKLLYHTTLVAVLLDRLWIKAR